jgi:ferritin-like protein
MASETLHAPRERLQNITITRHQAIVSLMEELEAADWYQQRADDCEDPALKEILLHNMREEIEHASMVLEWLRRNSSDWEKNLRTYLFTEAPITEIEDVADKGGGAGRGESGGPSGRGPFTVGPMKGS